MMGKITFAFLVLFFLLFGMSVFYFYPEKELPQGVQIDSILVFKSKRQLLVFSKGQLVKTYVISLGGQPIGKKEFEGDQKTPEGVYFINDKNSKSGYHKNLGISYPNQEDIENARLLERPPGGAIKIHGLRNSLGLIGKFHRFLDWTQGCIAMTNEEVDELFYAVKIGTRIEILP